MRAFLGTCLVRAVSRFVPDALCRFEARHLETGEVNKTAALTFDDGPTDRGTPELLEVLAKFRVPATFFLLGQQAVQYPERVSEVVQAGHVAGNHSWSHLNCWRSPAEQITREFDRAALLLEELTQQPLRWMRPPYGKVTPTALRWSRLRRQQMLLWDVMPPDFEAGVSVERLKRVLNRRLQGGSIVCLHDNAKSAPVTPRLLRETLPRLLEDGWRFVTLQSDYEPEDSGIIPFPLNGERGRTQNSDSSTSPPKVV